jgi:transposase
MRANLFWLNDGQWAKIEPLIPMNRPGRKPQNNRRILSGIIHVLKTGCRWQDCPPEYGPYTTVYNRFNRQRARNFSADLRDGGRIAPSRRHWTALMSKHIAAPAGEKGGVGRGPVIAPAEMARHRLGSGCTCRCRAAPRGAAAPIVRVLPAIVAIVADLLALLLRRWSGPCHHHLQSPDLCHPAA